MKSLGLFYLLFITLSQFVFTYSVDLSENAQSQCKKLGYPCCKKNNSHVYYHDKDGDWGYDFKKKEWCYIVTVQDAPQVTPKQGGNYVIYVDSKIEKNDTNFNNEVQSYINQIGQIIIDNLDTFEDKANLEQFQNEFKVTEGDVENVHNYNQDLFLYNNSRGNLVFMAYLNENILDDIKALPNVSTVEPEIRGIMDDKINITIEESNDPQVTPKQGGNYVIYVDSEITKNDTNFNNEVQSYINQIGQIIIDNLDTFEDKANLEQFQKEFKVTEGDVENVHNYNQDLFLYNNSRGNLVFMAYLNENILDDIKALPNVSTVEPEVRGIMDDKINITIEESNDPQVTPKQGGNYVIYVDSEITKNDPNFNNEVQSYINQIGQIIIDNLDTFEDKANLEQFQNEFKVTEGDVENVHNYNQDLFLYNNSRGNLVFMAYLNENILDDIKALPNVSTVEPEVRGTIDFKTTPKENEERQCEKLGYACCKEGNTNVYYQDKDGAWGYDFDEDEWCIIVNQPQNATPATQVTPKQGSDYVIYVDSEITKNDPNFNNEVQSYINQIGQIIIDNLNTFEDKDILEQFKNEFKVIEGNVENVHNYNQDLFLYNNSRGQLVFMAYLNRNIIDDVKALPNVSTVEKVTYGTYA